MSRPVGRLPNAIKVWADRIHTLAALSAKTRMIAHPDLFHGGEISDWRNHVHPCDNELIDAAIELGIWIEPRPGMADEDTHPDSLEHHP